MAGLMGSTKPRDVGRLRGFTLVEVLVATAVFAIFMVGILNLLDTSTRVSELERAIADTQENTRFAAYHVMRTARMAGGARMAFAADVGGSSSWLAGSLDSNQSGAFTTPYGFGSVEVLNGSDVLTLRGFFETAPFFIDATDVLGGPTRVVVQESSNGRVINRGFDLVETSLLAGRGLVLMGKLDQGEYAVGQVGEGSIIEGTAPDRTLTIAVADSADAWWSALNPTGATLPPAFDVYQVGVMESYTYFVDPEFRLMRLRADGSAAGATVQSVAVNIGGFQVVLGLDTDGDGLVDSWQATPTAAGIVGARVLSMRIAVLGRTPLEVPGWEEPAATFAVQQDTQAVDGAGRRAKWRRVEVVATLRNFLF